MACLCEEEEKSKVKRITKMVDSNYTRMNFNLNKRGRAKLFRRSHLTTISRSQITLACGLVVSKVKVLRRRVSVAGSGKFLLYCDDTLSGANTKRKLPESGGKHSSRLPPHLRPSHPIAFRIFQNPQSIGLGNREGGNPKISAPHLASLPHPANLQIPQSSRFRPSLKSPRGRGACNPKLRPAPDSS
jgi:hypothetical protein